MRRLPHGTLLGLPVRPGPGRHVHFYDQATVTRQVSGQPHGGIDLGGPVGTPIYAATGGRVPHTLAIGRRADGRPGPNIVPGTGYRSASGNYVAVVDEETGIFFYYFHLDAVSEEVTPGAVIRKHQQIGRMGNSGLSERSSHAPVHLHFQCVDHLHRHSASEEWYRELRFPVRNVNNLDPFQELVRLALQYPGTTRGSSVVQGERRDGYRIPGYSVHAAQAMDERP